MPLGLTIVKAHVIEDATGSKREFLVVQGPTGVLEPLLRYQLHGEVKGSSETWQKQLCQAVILLLEYADANQGCFEHVGDLFETFSWRLLTGTTDAAGYDDSGLYWEPRSTQVTNRAINHLTAFSAWLAKNYSVESINPLRKATRPEEFLAMAGWAHRKEKSFLGHTHRRNKAEEFFRHTPRVGKHRGPSIHHSEPPRFPERHFWRLIFEGFVSHPNVTDPLLRLDLRCVLITLLQHGGSVRTSECFHLWFQDVTFDPIDPTIALVRIGDPVDGYVRDDSATGKSEEITRAQYLQKHGFTPRSRLLGKKRAGWKHPRLDRGMFLHVYWRDPIFGRLFLKVWGMYLDQVARLPIPGGQPWAFVNLSRLEGRQGHPMLIGNYRKAHARAVERIGLQSSKADGTTPHGHRHAFIGWCKDNGVNPLSIQSVAHHKSLDSQLVYTQPGAKRIREEIAVANQRAAERNTPVPGVELAQKILEASSVITLT